MAKVATEYPKTLTMNLFAPGMSMMHRAGLGGLACSLRAIERDVQKKKLPENRRPGGKWAKGEPPWTITEQSITLDFGEAVEVTPSDKIRILFPPRGHLILSITDQSCRAVFANSQFHYR